MHSNFNNKDAQISLKKFEKYSNYRFKYKYRVDQNFINKRFIEEIIFNKKSHICSVYKELIIVEELKGVNRKYYKRYESVAKLHKIVTFFSMNKIVFPRLEPLHQYKYLQNNIRSKQKIIDKYENKNLHETNTIKENLLFDVQFTEETYKSIDYDDKNKRLKTSFNFKDENDHNILNKSADSLKSVENLINKIVNFQKAAELKNNLEKQKILNEALKAENEHIKIAEETDINSYKRSKSSKKIINSFNNFNLVYCSTLKNNESNPLKFKKTEEFIKHEFLKQENEIIKSKFVQETYVDRYKDFKTLKKEKEKILDNILKFKKTIKRQSKTEKNLNNFLQNYHPPISTSSSRSNFNNIFVRHSVKNSKTTSVTISPSGSQKRLSIGYKPESSKIIEFTFKNSPSRNKFNLSNKLTLLNKNTNTQLKTNNSKNNLNSNLNTNSNSTKYMTVSKIIFDTQSKNGSPYISPLASTKHSKNALPFVSNLSLIPSPLNIPTIQLQPTPLQSFRKNKSNILKKMNTSTQTLN